MSDQKPNKSQLVKYMSFLSVISEVAKGTESGDYLEGSNLIKILSPTNNDTYADGVFSFIGNNISNEIVTYFNFGNGSGSSGRGSLVSIKKSY